MSTRKTRDNGVEVLSILVWNDNVDGGIIIVMRYESSSVIGGVTVLDIDKCSIVEIRNTNWCNNQLDNAHQPACNFIVT